MRCARACLFLGCALLVAATVLPRVTRADELDDFISAKVQECKELTRKRGELASQAAQKGNTFSPEARAALDRLNTLADAAQNLIKTDSPHTAAEKEDYARKLSGLVGEGAMVTRSVQLGLGQNPFGVLERRLDGLQKELDKFKTKYGAFDNQSAHNPTAADINIARKPGTDFFSVSRQAAAGNAGAVVGGTVKPTTESDARAIAGRDGSWGGGIMLESSATIPWQSPKISYSSELNAFLFDDRGVYFLKVPPWITATLCRVIAGQKNQLVGVSLTGREGLVFGRREIYQNSILARDLMLADQFLADIIFGEIRWTQGYNFPDGYRPSHARIDRDLAVRFAFKDFRFAIKDEEIRSTGGSLEVRFAPLSAEKAGDGGLEPDYQALRDGYRPPAEFVANADGFISHLTYFRNEKLVARIFDYGETAALIRGLENAHADLNLLANTVEQTARIGSYQIALIDGNIQNNLENYWIAYLTELQSKGDHPNWSGPPYDLYRNARMNSFVSYVNRDLPGNDLQTIRNTTLETCSSQCKSTAECKAYSFDRWNRWCYLKSGIGQLTLEPRSITAIRSSVGRPQSSEAIIRMYRYRQKAFREGKILERVDNFTAGKCEQTCVGNEACIAYTFFKGAHQCILLTDAGEYFPDNGADSGAKQQDQ